MLGLSIVFIHCESVLIFLFIAKKYKFSTLSAMRGCLEVENVFYNTYNKNYKIVFGFLLAAFEIPKRSRVNCVRWECYGAVECYVKSFSLFPKELLLANCFKILQKVYMTESATYLFAGIVLYK